MAFQSLPRQYMGPDVSGLTVGIDTTEEVFFQV